MVRKHQNSPSRARKHNRKGRTKGGERFVKLDHYFLKSQAWRSLKPVQRALYLELAMRFNGTNNGEIALSVRDGARLVRAGKDTISRAFHQLEFKGFIRRNQCGSFDWKLRHATTWILTEHKLGDQLATKDFMRWRPSKTEPGPQNKPKRPSSGTTHSTNRTKRSLNGLHEGP